MTIRRTAALVFVGLSAAGAVGCSDDKAESLPSVSCGAGTTLEGSTCVAIAADAASPDASIAETSTVTCGAGTVLKDGECVVAPPGDGPTFAGLDTVTSTSPTSARLTWAAATGASAYRVYVTQKTGTESYGTPQYTTLPEKTSFDVTGLEPGGTYFFAVRAVNAGGVEDKNTVEKSIATSDDLVPPAFAGLLYADYTLSTKQAKLTWAEATDDKTGASEIAYDVYESTIPGAENFAGGPKVTVTGTNTATIDSVDNTISHYYVVLARDKSGNRNPNKNERKLGSVPNLTDHIMPIFVGIPGVASSGKCAIAGCHIGATAPSGLDLDSVDSAYANLVNVPAASRYVPWTKAELLAGTPTTIDVDGGTDPMGNVSFTATTADIQPSFGPPYNETTAIRVIPRLPLVSFMYQKITNTHKRTKSMDASNAQMPNPAVTSVTLTDEEKDRIRRWILGGALKGPI